MKVAIVILNWNGKSWLERFLPSVIKHSSGYQIIVADNASSDNSIEFLKLNFPSVEIIINKTNGGFAKGYNDALSHVSADFYLLLNSDVEVSENWLEPLKRHMKDPNIAAVQPKIRAFLNKDKFEYAGAAGGFIDKFHYPFCRGRIFENCETDLNQYQEASQVFWTSGACMLIRAEIYWKVGGLDERFFAHMEEIDMCWKIQRMGMKLMSEPNSVVYHVGGGTLDYNNPRKTFLNFRNSLLTITTNVERFLFLVILRRLVLDGLAGIMFLFQGKPKHLWAVIQSHFAYYGRLKSSIRERKKWRFLGFKRPYGIYQGSIIWESKIKGRKKMSDLNPQKIK